jgi:hypothetical protein
MRIGRHTKGGPDPQGLRDELKEILGSERPNEKVCGPSCQRAGPFKCSRDCPDIAKALSSDPERFPLETRIAPLVFELKRLAVFEPCWSCEGHNHPDGTLWKLPQVWFYCRSVAHLRVLGEGVKGLHVAEKLNVPWQVSVTHSDGDNTDTTFSLHPNIDLDTTNLGALQKDIDTIAAHLRDSVFASALALSRQAHA